MFNILIVDDDIDWRDTLSGMLRDEGYDAIEGARNAREAVEKYEYDTPFDFAFIDVRLDGDERDDISGITLSAIFRYMSPNTNIYLMSGSSLDQPFILTMYRAIHYGGAINFVSKHDIGEILNILKRAKQPGDKTETQTSRNATQESRTKTIQLSLSLENQETAIVRSRGMYVSAKRTSTYINLDTESFASRLKVVNSNQPNNEHIIREIKRIGNDFWRNVISCHSEIKNTFSTANQNLAVNQNITTSSKDIYLRLLFEGSLEHLRLPIEFIQTHDHDGDLVLNHPVSRFINGVETVRPPISHQFLGQVDKLKILLIASNTDAEILSEDRHMQNLGEESSGVPSNLYGRLRAVLLDCGPFNTDRELSEIFVDDRLNTWKDRLPEADSRNGRVASVIKFLYYKYNDVEENALVLLLHVLSEITDPGDACHQHLADLACELEREVKSRNSAGFDSAEQADQILSQGINSLDVDREIEQLALYFQRQKNVPVETVVVPTLEATIDRIRKELADPTYHIIHYAGHDHFNPASPKENPSSFWPKPGHKGKIQKMQATDFRWLRNSNVRLVYLSRCWRAASGTQINLLDDDFFDLADMIVHVGVPTVLGYRWPIPNASAPKLARTFYEALLEDGRPDVALWRARRELAAVNPNDLTWLSPILIHQV